MQSAATDVTAGKYATQDLAVQDIKQRMYTAALDDHAASTQPLNQAAGPMGPPGPATQP